MYKYNSLKKKWKEVIDSPSGSAAKKYVHKNAFDDEYGTRQAPDQHSCWTQMKSPFQARFQKKVKKV